MSTPLVSVISGYHNREDIVARTIESILNQSYKNIEFIIFDDCSTDETLARLQEYENRYPKIIRVISHDENKGFVSGIISAISNANGKYIAIQSSGDVSLNDRLAEQVSLLESDPNLAIAGCYYRNIIESSGVSRLRKPDANGLTFEKLLEGNLFSHGEVMFRKEHYLVAGEYRLSFRFCQDYDLWLRMIKIGGFATVKKELFHRYVQFDGVSYHPKNSILQAKYSIYAREIAKSEDGDSKYSLLTSIGIDKLVSDEHKELQKRVISNTLRSAVWGDVVGSKRYASNIISPLKRWSVVILITLINAKGFVFFKKVVQRVFGVKKHDL
jgi:glycosyltransferase involved in cell wall biosynthesis